jgi:hypothetical protein
MKNTHTFLPGWQFVTYGAGMEQSLQGVQTVANAMNNSSFTWQHKPGGDGFGHVIFGSYACGRPAVYWGSQYRGCLAEKLLEHGVTGIDVEQVETLQEVSQVLQLMAEPDNHKKVCEQAYNRFKATVNFDEDFEKIKKFLEDLR